MKIIADANIPFVDSYFSHAGNLILKPGREISRDDVRDADMLLVRSITKVNEALLKGSQLKFVGSVTAGMDHVDTSWLADHGIAYEFATGFNAPPVADYVISVIAALQQHQKLPVTFKAAVIGVGSVGRLVQKQLTAIGAEVILCDPIRAEREPEFVSTQLAAINDVDLITVHVPLTKLGEHPTYHFIDTDFLARQKSDCVLINASRGGVIATDVLLAASSRLTLCLDVFEHEPQVDHVLLQSVFSATPHIAGYSAQSKMRGVEMIYQAACQLGLMETTIAINFELPQHDVFFAKQNVRWQDVVLENFNPLSMTSLMRERLTDSHAPQRFDQMRNEFQSRHEFGYTKLHEINVSDEDRRILQRLGFEF